MAYSKKFFDNVWYVNGDSEYERYLTDIAAHHLPLDMVKAARSYGPLTINDTWVCGLNAFRIALTMVNYRNALQGRQTMTLPGIQEYPSSGEVIIIGTVGPDPIQYENFIYRCVHEKFGGGWCGGLTRHKDWTHIESWITIHLSKGNPVIALGSMGGYAHYFNIVGWSSKHVLILDNSGRLCCAHRSYIDEFMDVSLPFASGYSIFYVNY